MGFWDTEDGRLDETNLDTTFDAGGSDFELIPVGTVMPATITKMEWAEWDGVKYINGRWDVLDGPFKKRVIWQKFKVLDNKPSVRARALRLFGTVCMNTVPELLQDDGLPGDVALAGVCNTPMDIKVDIYETDNGKTGNYIDAIGKLGSLGKAEKKAAPAPAAKKAAAKPADEFDDDIPF